MSADLNNEVIRNDYITPETITNIKKVVKFFINEPNPFDFNANEICTTRMTMFELIRWLFTTPYKYTIQQGKREFYVVIYEDNDKNKINTIKNILKAFG